jgi:hypothetical protein
MNKLYTATPVPNAIPTKLAKLSGQFAKFVAVSEHMSHPSLWRQAEHQNSDQHIIKINTCTSAYTVSVTIPNTANALSFGIRLGPLLR